MKEKADAGKIAIDITREAKICGDTMKWVS